MNLVKNGFYSRVRALESVRGVQNGDTIARNGRIRKAPMHLIARCVFGAQLMLSCRRKDTARSLSGARATQRAL